MSLTLNTAISKAIRITAIEHNIEDLQTINPLHLPDKQWGAMLAGTHEFTTTQLTQLAQYMRTSVYAILKKR